MWGAGAAGVWTKDLRKGEGPERGAGESWPGKENRQRGTAPAKWCGLFSSAQRHEEDSQVGSLQVEVLPSHGTEAWSVGSERTGQGRGEIIESPEFTGWEGCKQGWLTQKKASGQVTGDFG